MRDKRYRGSLKAIVLGPSKREKPSSILKLESVESDFANRESVSW